MAANVSASEYMQPCETRLRHRTWLAGIQKASKERLQWRSRHEPPHGRKLPRGASGRPTQIKSTAQCSVLQNGMSDLLTFT